MLLAGGIAVFMKGWLYAALLGLRPLDALP